MFADGIGGRFHTRPDAETGPDSPTGGRAPAAAPVSQLATGCSDAPTLRVTVGVEPSARPAAGAGLCVERVADTGRDAVNTAVTARIVAVLHPRRANEGTSSPTSNGARKRTSAKRIAHAMTRLARIAVLVQNSRAVGPS